MPIETKLTENITSIERDELKNSTVLAFGCGSVASWSIEMLARGGVGTFVLVDDATSAQADQFSAFLYTKSLDTPLVELAKDRIMEINPLANVICVVEPPCGQLMERMFEQHKPELVLESTNLYREKAEILQFCVTRQVATVSAMGAGRRESLASINLEALENAFGCPLCKRVRKLIEFNERPCNEVVCIISNEPASNAAGEECRAVITGSRFVVAEFGIWAAHAAHSWLTQGYFPLHK